MTEPIVTIKPGQIKGKTDINLDGEQFYKFLGIPFAKPPLGPLRFKVPQPPDAWDGIRDCTKDGSASLCYEQVSKQILGSEDCLYLNVYTKELPHPGSTPKPVMVFIHGGGFTMGSGSESLHGPKNLLTEDIVLVTFNYRLGIFGFLSSDDLSLEVPGNAGLKDQTFALKWVQDNISRFNGDSNNVTIFGISAGAASVSFQILSPSAKGLFHKAIMQSGSALNPWAYGQKNSIQVAEKLGKLVTSEKEALDVLMHTPAEELLRAAIKMPDVVSASIRRPFGPVIEKANPTAFLTENPIDLMASGKLNQVPQIQGVVSNEGLVYESKYLGTQSPPSPEMGIFWYWGLEEGTEERNKLTKLIDEYYFKDGMNKEALYKLVGDVNFLVGAIKSTKFAVKTSAQPVYLYVYSRVCGLSDLMKTVQGLDAKLKGVSHGGDQTVIFNSSLMQLCRVEMNEDNIDAAKQIVKLWADFARTGKPHPNWEPVTDPNNLKYFEIDKTLTLKANPFVERWEFWDNILKDTTFDIYQNETPQL